jgi:membrane associated rhomboid family serine protease
MSSTETKSITRELKTQALILGGFVALIWAIEIVNLFVFRGALRTYGIYPRHLIGLRGVVFAPFLHGGIGHLMANTVPLITLGWLVMLRRTSDFFTVSVITMFVSGVGTWLFGATAFHIGASGLIFGYFGFLLLRGYFERNIPSLLLSIIVFFFYGGLIWGVLPTQPGVSWEGHLFGFLGGVLAARLIAEPSKANL